MARLNKVANPQTNHRPRRPALTERSDRSALASVDVPVSKDPISSSLRTETRGDIHRRTKSVSRRSKMARSGEFEIFPDSDRMGESQTEDRSQDSPSSPGKKSRTLKAANVNSLLLTLPQRPRRRPTVKLETDDYEKENDLTEDAMQDYTASMEATPQVPTRRNTTQTLGRSRINNRPLSYQSESEQEEEDDTVGDNSFNSLNDFIVSDNEELSYHETSGSETEEAPPSPPRTVRKRLMRGKRPDPEAELRKALDQPSQDLRLEPSLPDAVTTPSKPDAKPKQFQNDLNLSTELNQLSLDGDNEPISQLETELFNSVPERESSSIQQQTTNNSPKTPPSSPSRGRLRSPRKEKTRIPPTPFHETADDFWSQEVTNDWIDQHSPRKEQFSGCTVIDLLRDFDESENEEDSKTPPPCASDESDTMSRVTPKTPKTPSKTALKKAEAERKRELKARRMSFDQKKASVAEDFLQVLDDAVSGGEVRRLAEASGGVRIVWSKTLKTTAGRAHWKGQSVAMEQAMSCSPAKRTFCHHATIELAERIIDNEDRLLNTLAHEYCHLANYMVSNVHNNPHGASFKQWGRRCSEALKNHPVYGGRVTVTTKHNYKIDYKYVWCCEKCGVTYGRHSKSIDTDRARCGVCRGHLQQVKPKPRNVSPKKSAPSAQRGVDDVTRGLGEVSL